MSVRMKEGEFMAIVAESNGAVAGSGALWWMEDHPRPAVSDTRVPYILSMYTEHEFRGQGVATRIVLALLGEARRQGASRVTLHASSQGKPVYERLRFETTNEMRLWLRRPPGVRATPGTDPAVFRARGRAVSRR
jgi:GNAT superfamily N-acetyltransferase